MVWGCEFLWQCEAALAAGALVCFFASAVRPPACGKTLGFIQRNPYTQYLIRFSLAVSKTLAFLVLKLR